MKEENKLQQIKTWTTTSTTARKQRFIRYAPYIMTTYNGIFVKIWNIYARKRDLERMEKNWKEWIKNISDLWLSFENL